MPFQIANQAPDQAETRRIFQATVNFWSGKLKRNLTNAELRQINTRAQRQARLPRQITGRTLNTFLS